MIDPLFDLDAPSFKPFDPLEHGKACAKCPYNQEASMNQLKKLLKNQKGQGVMEYVIISSLVGIVCITAVKSFGEVIEKRIKEMQSSIVTNVKLK